jgi:oxygen-independent coproporphyrinogen-3 oxidase
VDLLFGLPEEAGSDPAEDVRRAADLEVPHVSLYELVAEPGTPLSTRIERGEVSLPGPDAQADTYLELVGVLKREGYEPYEMTSFARPGHASRHTLALWRGRPYLGLGPGAHSWVGGRRSWNLRDWRAYSTRARDAVTPRAGAERPDAEAAALERAWSRLRLREGASRAELAADPDPGTADEVRRRIDGLVEGWIRRGWARPEPGRVALTPEGWLRLDDLAPALAATRSG